ncbi:MAG: ABC transporter permease [Hyphomicrobiales bacterium]|nr:ABC transporter permease [Hyphomicrobiales bacterium]MDE2017632.1 ABC transporter permease [Hyphomicrobiales bacterium]
MNATIVVSIAMSIVAAATPLLLAALGELVAEKSGTLNLGVEGMMLLGAVSAAIVALTTGDLWLAAGAAALAGALGAGLFAVLTLSLTANQVATGLALTIFGQGVSSLVGKDFVGREVHRLPEVFPAALAEHPLARVLFGYDAFVYFSVAAALAVAWFLSRTRAGLVLRAVGEGDSSAHALGYRVIAVRYGASLFGGAMAGLAGAYFSLSLTPTWAVGLTAGRGWIALALVTFSGWRPGRLLFGAYLFGAMMIFELQAKAFGLTLVPPEALAMAPYLATIAALTIISAGRAGANLRAPACLGKPFRATA